MNNLTPQEAKRANRFLKLEQVLFEFMEPILILFKSGNTHFFASALPSKKGFIEEYLVVTTTPKIFKRYFRNDVDLRFLYESNPYRSFYKISAADLGKDKVKAVPFDNEVTEEMLPDPQLFATSHSAEYKPMARKHDALETLYIDGNWEMEDFGNFSSRYRDIYSFEQAIEKLKEEKTSIKEKKKITVAFQGNTLHAGGSYVSFFKDLSSVIPANEQYDLARVQYASPGKIELNGTGRIFDSIEIHVKNMISNDRNIRIAHNELRESMSKYGFLEISQTQNEARGQEAVTIKRLTLKLLSEMNSGIYDVIYEATGKSVVSTAKISLALFRRIRAASMFFAEGKAVFER